MTADLSSAYSKRSDLAESLVSAVGNDFHTVTPKAATSSAQCAGSRANSGSASTSAAPAAIAPNKSQTDRQVETQRSPRGTLREHHQAELAAARALTDAERTETQLETERADRRTLTSHLTTVNGSSQAQPARQPSGGARTT